MDTAVTAEENVSSESADHEKSEEETPAVEEKKGNKEKETINRANSEVCKANSDTILSRPNYWYGSSYGRLRNARAWRTHSSTWWHC